jgi:AhpD family alkylhydroperoxidase
MTVLSTAASKDIDPDLAGLIKIRASQINHCALCLDMHTRDARTWREARDLFTERGSWAR